MNKNGFYSNYTLNRTELINKHREQRTIYEEQARKIITEWKEKYYPNKQLNITFTDNEWDKTDFYINSKSKCELKIRWIKSINMYNQYKKQGFYLSQKKLDNNDYFYYYIPITKELLYITKKQIQNGLANGYITTTEKEVNQYQFATELGKKKELLFVIPYDCWKVYYM